MFPYYYIILYAIAVLLAINRLSCAKRKEALFLLAGAGALTLLAYAEGADVITMLVGLLVFNGLAYSYGTRRNYAYLALAVMFVLFMENVPQLAAQAMLFGFLSNSYAFVRRSPRKSARVERERDLVQAGLGIGFVVVFAVAGGADAMYVAVYAILAASLLGNYASLGGRGRVSSFLLSLEREKAAFGQGAFWLAAGVLLAISFLAPDTALAVIVAIVLGDAAATLAGMRYRIALPYNRKKSMVGTAAYFIVASIASFPFVGVLGVGIAALGAIMESLPMHIDDNFDTSLVLTLVLRAAIYFGLLV